METHNLVQGTPEWQNFRLAHFTASEAAAMLGMSKHMTRAELMKLKKLGIEQEHSEWYEKNVLDHGHEVEANARQLVEAEIGEELFPVTCSEGKLSASCDGLTMDGAIAFEHKQYNASLIAAIEAGSLPDEYLPQVQQILLVTGAAKVIFVCSDGTAEGRAKIEIEPDASWFARLEDGWQMFEQDLADFVPAESKPEIVGRAPDELPALLIEVTGAVTKTNLPEFKAAALAVIGSIKTNLETDEDFANAEKTAKWCKKAEGELEAAKRHALAQTADIDELYRTVDAINEELRRTRLTLEKGVKQQKEAIKTSKIAAARAGFIEHVKGLQAEIDGVRFEPAAPNFAEAIKGKRTLDSIDNALAATLVNAKLDADALAKDYRVKLAWFAEHAAAHRALFADLQQLVAKPADDFERAINERIERAAREEAARREAAERAKAESEEARAKVQSFAPPVAPVPTAPPVSAPPAPERKSFDEALIDAFLACRNFGTESLHIRAVLSDFMRFYLARQEKRAA
ncbi:MAG: YqaJ viral recombinase family protein [Azoarcus sp.]|jgi:predicted phage-related endonuclease|nr:YqaJ viral recombinase family protein [Azoarcus sp.]